MHDKKKQIKSKANLKHHCAIVGADCFTIFAESRSSSWTIHLHSLRAPMTAKRAHPCNTSPLPLTVPSETPRCSFTAIFSVSPFTTVENEPLGASAASEVQRGPEGGPGWGLPWDGALGKSDTSSQRAETAMGRSVAYQEGHTQSPRCYLLPSLFRV